MGRKQTDFNIPFQTSEGIIYTIRVRNARCRCSAVIQAVDAAEEEETTPEQLFDKADHVFFEDYQNRALEAGVVFHCRHGYSI